MTNYFRDVMPAKPGAPAWRFPMSFQAHRRHRDPPVGDRRLDRRHRAADCRLRAVMKRIMAMLSLAMLSSCGPDEGPDCRITEFCRDRPVDDCLRECDDERVDE